VNCQRKTRLSNDSMLLEQNPWFAEEILRHYVEMGSEFLRLRDYLQKMPWSLKEIRRFARDEGDSDFCKALEDAEGLDCEVGAPAGIEREMNEVNMTEIENTERKRGSVTEQRKRELADKGREARAYFSKDLFREEDGNLVPNVDNSDETFESFGLIAEATGLRDLHAAGAICFSAGNALGNSTEDGDGHLAQRMNKMARLMSEFKPRDAVESCLVVQLVTCQEMALRFMGQCGMQKTEGWHKTLANTASKFFTRSQAALQQLVAYRKDGQTITVQHLHAEAGSKVAVGHFEAHQGGGGVNQKNSLGTP